MLLRDNCAQSESDEAPVCLPSVLEYLAAELVDVAGGEAVDSERVYLPHHLHLVICKGEELNRLAANMTTPPLSVAE
ncbi:unnamed protein product [Hydatigera taeniaeformis]|uniref:Histone H2A n=1 Tax=Hydatigena taeniaeformis TaxID=6205 RepID=A0A0R3WYH6_HYDTA|nr:unnamed protein product [Hydatigera taeniaeformis]